MKLHDLAAPQKTQQIAKVMESHFGSTVGSLAIGNTGAALFLFEPKTLGTLGFVSLIAKLLSAVLAFLLALWFKK